MCVSEIEKKKKKTFYMGKWCDKAVGILLFSCGTENSSPVSWQPVRQIGAGS